MVFNNINNFFLNFFPITPVDPVKAQTSIISNLQYFYKRFWDFISSFLIPATFTGFFIASLLKGSPNS